MSEYGLTPSFDYGTRLSLLLICILKHGILIFSLHSGVGTLVTSNCSIQYSYKFVFGFF